MSSDTGPGHRASVVPARRYEDCSLRRHGPLPLRWLTSEARDEANITSVNSIANLQSHSHPVVNQHSNFAAEYCLDAYDAHLDVMIILSPFSAVNDCKMDAWIRRELRC